jgi:hypothetical protein
MKPSEIRKKLHKYVDDADNESLQFISEAVALYKAQKQDEDKEARESNYPWAPSEEELFAMIEQSEENLKNGNYFTHEEVVAKLDALRKNYGNHLGTQR